MPMLRLRATFIEAGDDQAVRDRRRAQTLPCQPSLDEAEDLFRDERAYVAELDTRFGAGAHKPNVSNLVVPECFNELSEEKMTVWNESEVGRRNRLVSSMLLSAKIRQGTGREASPRAAIFDTETRAPSSASLGDGASPGGDTSKDLATVTGTNSLHEPEPDRSPPHATHFAAGECFKHTLGERRDDAPSPHAPPPSSASSAMAPDQCRDELRHTACGVAKRVTPPPAPAVDASEGRSSAAERLASACGAMGVACPRLLGNNGFLALAMRCTSLRQPHDAPRPAPVKGELGASGPAP
mmetsp:Transcript_75556/g.148295  ORF Transcript_75556/g.148295 Transcript_75556/m.148295 type:complete len:297 (-) Transcript_75556:292-1182(-)